MHTISEMRGDYKGVVASSWTHLIKGFQGNKLYIQSNHLEKHFIVQLDFTHFLCDGSVASLSGKLSLLASFAQP